MVFKNIEYMKKALPDLIHIVIFYDNGIIFQTTFTEPINIPKVGEVLSENLKKFKDLFDLTHITAKHYKKLIYETMDFVTIILKLGEQSNVALFFKKGETEPKISAIRRYLYRIEDIMDTDKLELEKHKLVELKKELSEYNQEINANLKKIAQKKLEFSNFSLEIEKIEDQIAAFKTDLLYEDRIGETLEQIIEEQKEIMEDVIEKEIKKELKRDIKEDEKGLKVLEKSLIEEEKEIDQLKAQITNIEEKKEGVLSDINAIIEENKKLQHKTSKKSSEIAIMEDEVQKLEKEKLERKLLD